MRTKLGQEKEGLHVAIYIRKSRKDRASTEPRLKKQRTELPVRAKEMGATSHTIYDDGYCSASKKNVGNLPERNRLIGDVKSGKVDIILVIEISRLSRDDSMKDMMDLLDICKNNCVRLATPNRIFNPADTNDWTLLTIEGCMSAVEMKKTLERMEQGASHAFINGQFLGGGAPKPYVYDKATRKLVVDQTLLRQCKRLWRLAETHSAKAISEIMEMTYISVRRSISDKRLDFLQAIRRNPETGEEIRCEWEPVMSAEQAARIRTARMNRATNGNCTKPNSLLTGLDILKCGYCGSTVKSWCNGKPRKDGTKLKYYGCCTKNNSKACPKSRTLPQFILDEKVVTNIFNTISCLEDLMRIWVTSQGNEDFMQQIKSLENEERIIQGKLERLLDTALAGDFPDDLITKKKRQLNSELTDVRDEQQSLRSRQTSPPDWDSLLLTRDEFEHLDFIDMRRFLTLILDEIRLYEKYAILTFNFPRARNGDRTTRIHLPGPCRGTTWGRNPRYKSF